MMKRFLTSGKWLGLMLLAFGLLFAGCQGPSSSEGTVGENGTQESGVIPVTFDPQAQKLTFGDGSDFALGNINGHTIEVRNGDSACFNAGDLTNCWIRITNRDPSNYVANLFLDMTYCPTCTTARVDNSDYNSKVVTHGPGDGNAGTGVNFTDGPGYAVLEDGDYNQLNPYNVLGAPYHVLSQAVGPSNYAPFQMLAPQCGARSILWDFGGQAAPIYRFVVQLRNPTGNWFPFANVELASGRTSSDSRFDLLNKSTFYLMVTDLADKLAVTNRAWYRIGSYVRSNVLSGYGSSGSGASFAPGRYFGLNVALEYPNRMEQQLTGNIVQFTNYEFYASIPFLVRYDPNTIKRVTALGKTSSTGTMMYNTGTGMTTVPKKICLTTASLLYCDKSPTLFRDTWTGLKDPLAAYGWGFVYVLVDFLDTAFSVMPTGAQYITLNGVTKTVQATPSSANDDIPAYEGHVGRAHIRTGGAAAITTANTAVVQEGVDQAPDVPLAMMYFRVRMPTGDQTIPRNGAYAAGSYRPSKRGSEFWLNQYSAMNTILFQWTKGTLLLSGSGNDDYMQYCMPYYTGYVQGCNNGLPQSSYAVYGGREMSNASIKHTGKSVPNGGATQVWGAWICVQ